MTTRELTKHERTILELLTAGEYPGADAARAQIAGARHAGEWSPGDPSFHLATDESCPRLDVADGILRSSDRPLLGIDGSPGGGLMLWVTGGRISDVECYWFDDADRRLPAPEQITTWDDPRIGG
jgi:hypothetical protein